MLDEQAIFDPSDDREPWESDDSRRRRNAWRGSAASEALREGRKGASVPPAALEQLVRSAYPQIVQMLGLHQLVREVHSLRQHVRDLEEWKSRREAEAVAPAQAELEFLEELRELYREEELVVDEGWPEGYDPNALFEGWE